MVKNKQNFSIYSFLHSNSKEFVLFFLVVCFFILLSTRFIILPGSKTALGARGCIVWEKKTGVRPVL